MPVLIYAAARCFHQQKKSQFTLAVTPKTKSFEHFPPNKICIIARVEYLKDFPLIFKAQKPGP